MEDALHRSDAWINSFYSPSLDCSLYDGWCTVMTAEDVLTCGDWSQYRRLQGLRDWSTYRSGVDQETWCLDTTGYKGSGSAGGQNSTHPGEYEE